MDDLITQHCKACEGGIPKLNASEITPLLNQLSCWEVYNDYSEIKKVFHFGDYYKTLAFVNAVAWISHRENHHPVMEVSFKTCSVRYFTHAVKGLTENDFICAAKVDALLQTEPAI